MVVMVRKKLFKIIEKDTTYYEWYDILILVCVWVSIIPLTFKQQNNFTYSSVSYTHLTLPTT